MFDLNMPRFFVTPNTPPTWWAYYKGVAYCYYPIPEQWSVIYLKSIDWVTQFKTWIDDNQIKETRLNTASNEYSDFVNQVINENHFKLP